jgi:hypothetical protein
MTLAKPAMKVSIAVVVIVKEEEFAIDFLL